MGGVIQVGVVTANKAEIYR